MVKKQVILVFLVMVSLFAFTACTAELRIVQGSGNLVTERRQVSNFDSIELSGSGQVIVTQNGSEGLLIETDDNVMEYIDAKVEDGVLKLGLKTGIQTGVNVQSHTRLVFYVEIEKLNSLTTSGSGKIESDRVSTGRLSLSVSGSGAIQIANLSASDVTADLSGSGEIDLAGEVDLQDIAISGSGSYSAGDVCSQAVQVKVSGSGSATVCATGTLDADLSGSGSVDYYGSPEVTLSGSGSGRVNRLGDD